MKKITLLVLLGLFTTQLNAQLLTLKTVEQIKGGKIAVALSEDDEEFNRVWKATIEKRWDFTPITEFLSENEAFDKLKNNEVNYVLIFNPRKVSFSLSETRGDYKYRYYNEGMGIEIRSAKNRIVAVQYVPPFGDDNVFAESFLAFGIDALQSVFNTMIENNMKNNMRLYDAFNKKGASLKELELVLAEPWLHKKMTKELAREIYEGDLAFISFSHWNELIIDQISGKAYIAVVPVPTGKSYIYLHYIINAETGEVIGMGQPKSSFGVYSYSKGNSGYINEKNLEIYNDVLNSK